MLTFFWFPVVSGLLNRLWIFWQLCLIELLGLLKGRRLPELQYLIYTRLLTEFGKLVFFKLWCYRMSGQVFGLISSFLSNRQLQVVLDGKSSQEHPANARVPQRFILGPRLFVLYINELPDVICNIVIYADDTALYSKCDQVSYLWH